jgi:hypothetical protein
MESMDSPVFVNLPLLEKHVKRRWIHVALVHATMRQLVLLLQIIETFSVHVHLDSREDFAMKTSTNVLTTIHAGTAALVSIQKAAMTANVELDMKVAIV